MNRLCVGITAVAIAMGGIAQADPVPIGDPMDGNSWGQEFAEDLVVSLDFMGVHMVSAGDSFESAVFRNFGGSDYGGGWSDSLAGGAMPQFGVATGPTIAASGGLSAFTFEIWFDGLSSDWSNGLRTDPLVFDFVAYNGDVRVDGARASFNGSGWSFTALPSDSWDREDYESVIPLPSVAGLSGLGLIGIGLRRRQRVSF